MCISWNGTRCELSPKFQPEAVSTKNFTYKITFTVVIWQDPHIKKRQLKLELKLQLELKLKYINYYG